MILMYLKYTKHFAGQVLANLNALKSVEWCKKQLGLDKAIGQIPLNKLNQWGGS